MNIDYKNHRNLVRQGFTEKYKFPIGDGRTMPSLNIQHQKHDILLEEINEYYDALSKRDLIETLDALCDIEFVIHGAMDSYGFDFDEERFKKEYNIDFKISIHAIADYFSINYRAYCFSGDLKSIEDLFYKILVFHYNKTGTYYYNFTTDSLRKYELAFLEVCRSNGTKSCKSKDALHATIAQPKYKGVEFIHVEKNGEFALYRKDNGKLIKSIDYSPADVSPFIP